MADHPVWGIESGGVCKGISADREAGGQKALCAWRYARRADRRQGGDRFSGNGGYDPLQDTGAAAAAL